MCHIRWCCYLIMSGLTCFCCPARVSDKEVISAWENPSCGSSRWACFGLFCLLYSASIQQTDISFKKMKREKLPISCCWKHCERIYVKKEVFELIKGATLVPDQWNLSMPSVQPVPVWLPATALLIPDGNSSALLSSMNRRCLLKIWAVELRLAGIISQLIANEVWG